jgi:hypothetical protein
MPVPMDWQVAEKFLADREEIRWECTPDLP